jgi:8-oxo-dGTP pyrophosphatase MutT (NUDIX family)
VAATIRRRRDQTGAAAAHLPSFPDARASAVLIALADGPRGAEVLLTKRSMHLTNHRGEISFPGGRVDADESFEQTALREAHEEVSLPGDRLEIAGRLDPLSTVVSRSYIVPVVGTVQGPTPELAASAAEVDRIMWVPLAELTRADTYREEWWGTPPTDRPMFFFHLDDETIWGATARILHQLLRVALGVVAPEPPVW